MVIFSKSLDLKGFLWCCKGGLNSRPHPYQGCALPLSYCSTLDGLRFIVKNMKRKRYLDPAQSLLYGVAMSKDQSQMTDKEKAAAERAERLRKQLRENLRRRKAQVRSRKATETKG